MRLIEEVRDDLRSLKGGREELRKFGLLVGGALVVIGGLGWWRAHHSVAWGAVGAAGAILALAGAAVPASLKGIRRGWMAATYVLGWFVSRLILVLLYYGVLSPVAVVARLSGKRFLDLKFRGPKESYWISRDVRRTTSYDRMI